MFPVIVPTYAAILVLIFVFLSIRVIQMRGSAKIGLGHGNRRQTQPRLRRKPHVALPRAQTATSTGGAIIIPPRIDSGHGEQDRRPIRPAPPEGQ